MTVTPGRRVAAAGRLVAERAGFAEVLGNVLHAEQQRGKLRYRVCWLVRVVFWAVSASRGLSAICITRDRVGEVDAETRPVSA